MFDTALLLAHGHIGDLLAEADRERQADLIRSSRGQVGRTRTIPKETPTVLRRVLRALRAMPRATVR
jgi:hypothetical protein